MSDTPKDVFRKLAELDFALFGLGCSIRLLNEGQTAGNQAWLLDKARDDLNAAKIAYGALSSELREELQRTVTKLVSEALNGAPNASVEPFPGLRVVDAPETHPERVQDTSEPA